MSKEIPGHYLKFKKSNQAYFEAVEKLGETIRSQGPLQEKESQLVQLAASVAIQSEGATHSHVRRAMKAGATKAEIHHSILLLTSTIGFPRVMAGISWANDILDPSL